MVASLIGKKLEKEKLNLSEWKVKNQIISATLKHWHVIDYKQKPIVFKFI